MQKTSTERSASPTYEGPRPARLDERETLLAMINFIFRMDQGRAPTIATDWAHVYAPENLANVMVICDPQREAAAQPRSASVTGTLVASTGVWVSEVAVGGHVLRVGGINCVGTLPEYRRDGLGSQVMEAAQQQMRALGCQVGLLSTGITNWYRRLGWESAGRFCNYAVNRGNLALLPELRAGLRVRVVDVGDGLDAAVAAAVVRLRAQAQLGAARTVAGLQQLVMARAVERVVVAEDAGEAVAYVMVRGHTVIEWAGDPLHVLGLMRATFTLLDDPALSTSQRGQDGAAPSLRTLTVQSPGPELAAVATWLDARGFLCRAEYLGMLYVVDPQGVLDAFGLADVELTTQVTEEGAQHFTVRVGKARVTVDRGQLVKLLFGPERLLDEAQSPFPLPCWQWPLEMV